MLFTKLLAVFVLAMSLVSLQAQTYVRIAGQSDWVTGVPAGSVIAWGDGTHFSATKTTTATAYPSAGFEASSGQFVVPAGLTGPVGLYVLEGSAAVALKVTPLGKATTSITVPAIAPPPPTQTYATTCSTTLNPTTGMISIVLNATPSN